jgi:thiamine-phosphate diphosphorylase
VSTWPEPVVCLVTDRRRLAWGRSDDHATAQLEQLLETAVGAGVDLILIREPDLEAGRLCRLTRRVVAYARGTSVRVLVNDRADVALAAGADGVHLRADSMPPGSTRTLAPGWMIGRSVHSGDEHQIPSGADYFLFGNVFTTSSKPGMPAAGTHRLGSFATAAEAPVLAIGGLTPENAAECWRAGAAGIAAITPFLPAGTTAGALGVSNAVRAFRAALAEAAKVTRPSDE